MRFAWIGSGQGLTGDWHDARIESNSQFFETIGFDGQHASSNGVAMLSTASNATSLNRATYHSGSHKSYNDRILDEVTKIRERYVRDSARNEANARRRAVKDLEKIQRRERRNLSAKGSKDRCPIRLS